ncbi:MAG: glycosyltransferase family 4 protein [Verrucomicrobiota bacterium]
MTADTVGGVWTYALELIRGLGSCGIQVALATMGRKADREQRQELAELGNVELFESEWKLEWMENPWPEVDAAGSWLLDLEKSFEPDLIHLNGYSHAALPWSVPTIVVGHSCVLSWWRGVKGEMAPGEWDPYRYRVGRGIAAADLVVTPSQAMLSALRFFYGPIPKAMVIANGRDPGRFVPGEKENFILAAGRLWDEAKNIQTLSAIADNLPWPVYLAGEERHPEGDVARFQNVRFLGRLSTSELAAWYARAAVFALPARYEPFGLSVLEAALAGCALVLGDIASLREIWQDAAWYVPPDNGAQLASALHDLLAAPETRRELALRARQRARQFTPEQMLHGYLDAYQSVLPATQPAAQPILV